MLFSSDEEMSALYGKFLDARIANTPQGGGPAMVEGRGTPDEMMAESARQQTRQVPASASGLGQILAEGLAEGLAAGPGLPLQIASLVSSPTKDAEALIGGAATIKGLQAASDAFSLFKKGLSNKEVYDQSGIYKGPLDREMRAVISDEKALLRAQLGRGESKTLGEFLDHPELYKSYPDIKDLLVTQKDLPPGVKASYSPSRDSISIGENDLGSLLHELQHALQTREGFVPGSSLGAMKKSSLIGEGLSDTRTIQELLVERMARKDSRNLPDILAEKLYRLVGGEAEARAVETQLRNKDWTTLPTDLYDVPASAVIPSR